MSKIVVVSAAIVDFDRKLVMLSQRSHSTSYPATWCTPGGKVEAGEFPLRALWRELNEELDLVVDMRGIETIVYQHDMVSTKTGAPVAVFCYLIPYTSVHGRGACLDGTIGIGWFGADMLTVLPMAAADNAHRDKLIALVSQ